jgi:hypothetical protein
MMRAGATVRLGITVVAGLLVACAGAGVAGAELLGPHEIDPVAARRLHAEQRWEQVITTFETAGAGTDQTYVAADAASVLSAEVIAEGWASPKVPGLVGALITTANPDGGYGLAKPWDAYQDGTENPASTSYTATTAGHVGPTLLAGYLAGVVPASAVERAVDSILDLPRSYGGRCIPYSNSAFDRGKPCVWNVHFGAADWALRAAEATGHRTQDAAQLARIATGWLAVLPQNPRTGYWPYSSAGGGPQDIGHQLWTAAAVDNLLGTHDAMALTVAGPLWRSQARMFHDYNVASAMSGIALFDCRYALDPDVLRFAGSTLRGNPYAHKALASQARAVVRRCFGTAPARTRGSEPGSPLPVLLS